MANRPSTIQPVRKDSLSQAIARADTQIKILQSRAPHPYSHLSDQSMIVLLDEWEAMLKHLVSLKQANSQNPIFELESDDDESEDDHNEDDTVGPGIPITKHVDPPRDWMEQMMANAEVMHKTHPEIHLIVQLPASSRLIGEIETGTLSRLEHNPCFRLKDGSFLKSIFSPSKKIGPGFIIGYRLLRQSQWETLMPTASNEVVLQQVEDPHGVIFRHVRVPVEQIQEECTIYFTNQPYEHLNYTKDVGNRKPDLKNIFFCRWERRFYMKQNTVPGTGAIEVHQKKGAIERLLEIDADPEIVDSKSSTERIPCQIPDRSLRPGRKHSGERHRYTFTDSFCGAGGASLGAWLAGLAHQHAFDACPETIVSYKTNFRDTGVDARLQDVSEFIQEASRTAKEGLPRYMVDILHLSPPCQPFSPANTRPNHDMNKQNISAFYQCEKIIKACKPRLVTMEETFGIADRKRLIVVAAGPGEKLPPLPSPTRYADALPPFQLPTIQSELSRIPNQTITPHMIREVLFKPKRKVKGIPSLDQASKTITTSGNTEDIYYPGGYRGYTNIELAVLQTFWWNFVFAGTVTEQRLQIGNAMPPTFAGTLFFHLRTWLEKADAEEQPHAPAAPPAPPAPSACQRPPNPPRPS
ncbi:hypothetical protein H2200_012196 [Cladophialophora chaetospira]|uniref:DNA (cytosine-5-)-methyltransferase n=1 Tax=Cladophialophora chaetospira TaxID=386627 RepID=A0AA38WYC5_9EURO|nr:hypothetical protein H2200_012196 [Cladophialophora chaetospira]